MPLIAERVTVPANGTAFPMAGKQYEFMHAPGMVEIAIVAAATGVLATVFSGSDLLQQEGQVTIKAANTAPVYPDDYHLRDAVLAMDRLNILLRNTTGAAIDVFTYVQIDEVA
jgi:hypothetical protein